MIDECKEPADVCMVLNVLSKNKLTTIDNITRLTGFPEVKVYTILSYLEAKHYIKRHVFRKNESCDKCPLRSICKGSCPSQSGEIVFYEFVSHRE